MNKILILLDTYKRKEKNPISNLHLIYIMRTNIQWYEYTFLNWYWHASKCIANPRYYFFRLIFYDKVVTWFRLKYRRILFKSFNYFHDNFQLWVNGENQIRRMSLPCFKYFVLKNSCQTNLSASQKCYTDFKIFATRTREMHKKIRSLFSLRWKKTQNLM